MYGMKRPESGTVTLDPFLTSSPSPLFSLARLIFLSSIQCMCPITFSFIFLHPVNVAHSFLSADLCPSPLSVHHAVAIRRRAPPQTIRTVTSVLGRPPAPLPHPPTHTRPRLTPPLLWGKGRYSCMIVTMRECSRDVIHPVWDGFQMRCFLIETSFQLLDS